MVEDITYTDHLGGASGEIEVGLQDTLRYWQGPWLPSIGDTTNLKIGYEGEALLPCGDFEIDEYTLDGPPDKFKMRCLAAGITPAMRTTESKSFENVTLMDVAKEVAAANKLNLVGTAAPFDVVHEVLNKSRETDLEFLRRLARLHNYDFTVRGKDLIFWSRAALEATAPVFTIVRSDTERFEFKDHTHMIYRSSEVRYFDPKSKKLITGTATATGRVATKVGDVLKIETRVENATQAIAKATGALHQMNLMGTTANLTLPGTTALVAGNNVNLSGWAAFDGTYMIAVARHRLSRDHGYTTEIETYAAAAPA
jgi:phage protein D